MTRTRTCVFTRISPVAVAIRATDPRYSPVRPPQETLPRTPPRSAPPPGGTPRPPCATAPLPPSPARYAYTCRWGTCPHRGRVGNPRRATWPPAGRAAHSRSAGDRRPPASAEARRVPRPVFPRDPPPVLREQSAATRLARATVPRDPPVPWPGRPPRGRRLRRLSPRPPEPVPPRAGYSVPRAGGVRVWARRRRGAGSAGCSDQALRRAPFGSKNTGEATC